MLSAKIGITVLSVLLLAGLSATNTAADESSVTDLAPASSCVGASFSGTLGPDRSICKGNYRVIMQKNGDLVLWQISPLRACWRSRTDGHPGADTSATFHMRWFGAPFVTIDSVAHGELKRIIGAHTYQHLGTNANVNAKGEFWIGYKRIGWC